MATPTELLVLVILVAGAWAVLATLFTPPITSGWREAVDATVRLDESDRRPGAHRGGPGGRVAARRESTLGFIGPPRAFDEICPVAAGRSRASTSRCGPFSSRPLGKPGHRGKPRVTVRLQRLGARELTARRRGRADPECYFPLFVVVCWTWLWLSCLDFAAATSSALAAFFCFCARYFDLRDLSPIVASIRWPKASYSSSSGRSQANRRHEVPGRSCRPSRRR